VRPIYQLFGVLDPEVSRCGCFPGGEGVRGWAFELRGPVFFLFGQFFPDHSAGGREGYAFDLHQVLDRITGLSTATAPECSMVALFGPDMEAVIAAALRAGAVVFSAVVAGYPLVLAAVGGDVIEKVHGVSGKILSRMIIRTLGRFRMIGF